MIERKNSKKSQLFTKELLQVLIQFYGYKFNFLRYLIINQNHQK